MKSAVIIGKGPSILKTTPDYINRFDDVIICNKPIWDGYDKHIPKKARIQFTNNSTDRFTEDEIKELGLQEVISTALPGEQLNVPEYYYRLVKMMYPHFESGPNQSILYRTISGNTFSPSTGVIAFSYAVECADYNKISMVGFDLLNKGDRMYYFEPEDLQSNLHYLFNKGTILKEGFLYNQENGHDHHALEYIKDLIRENTSIDFEFTTTSETLTEELKDFRNVSFHGED
tara:strand:- start:591 stop:1283 length:693 start_codon:yes stop_codon:yes gene_type:complete